MIFTIHWNINNKRFCCLQYGIKRLAKVEAALEAKRYNKDYPGQMLHGDTKRLPFGKGRNPWIAGNILFLRPSTTSLGNSMQLSCRTRPKYRPKPFWSKSWRSAPITIKQYYTDNGK